VLTTIANFRGARLFCAAGVCLRLIVFQIEVLEKSQCMGFFE